MVSKVHDILKKNGLTPTSTSSGSTQETPEEKAARELKEKESQQQQQPASLAETPEEKAARELKEKESQQQQQPASPAETPEEKAAREKAELESKNKIDDDTLLAELRKRGKRVESLDDIDRPAPVQLTEEQIQQAEQQKQDAIRQFALKNKKVTSTDFDNYVRETSIPSKELAFLLYKNERLEDLKKSKVPADQLPNDQMLKDEFDETHFQYADENDPKRIRSEKLLQKTVDEYIGSKYEKILNLEDEYNTYEKTTKQRDVYGSVIDSVINDLGSEMTFEIPIDTNKTFPFKFKITPDVQSAIKAAYLNDTSFSLFGQGDVNKELLQQAVHGNVIQREFKKILQEAVLAYSSAVLNEVPKGRRGIPPSRKEEGSDGGEKRVNKVVAGLLNTPDNKKILQTS